MKSVKGDSTDEPAMTEPIAIRPFEWKDWAPLCRLGIAQLAEHGIILDPKHISDEPEGTDRDCPEWDLDHVEEVYLSGAGGFWLACCGDMPVGQGGAQDLGGLVELRRMYVRAEDRRRGIGARLVNALIEHMKGPGFEDALDRPDEIRMRLDLADEDG
ncbi:MAG: GNAT family N-acetyltransferase [Candidatus Hydrogenedentes bacterium]|nr:GNAT family N-acetyltransferase [Candidatus Hydrogenedentota bacterium]